ASPSWAGAHGAGLEPHARGDHRIRLSTAARSLVDGGIRRHRNAPLWTRLSDTDCDADRSGSLPSVRRIWDHTTPLSAVQRPDLFARELSAGRRAPSRRVLAAKSPAWREGRAEQRCRWVWPRDPRGETAALVSVVPHPGRMDAHAAVLR